MELENSIWDRLRSVEWGRERVTHSMGNRLCKAEPHKRNPNQANPFRKQVDGNYVGRTEVVQKKCVKLKERGLEIEP